MRNVILLIVLGAVFLFMGNNVLPLTNPDEVFYVETAKEMAQRGTWTTPYIFDQPQFEKPVLTYDFIRVGFLMFGDTPFAGRFFPAVFGLLGVLAAYFLARWVHRDERKALLGAVVLMTSALYFGLSRTLFMRVSSVRRGSQRDWSCFMFLPHWPCSRKGLWGM